MTRRLGRSWRAKVTALAVLTTALAGAVPDVWGLPRTAARADGSPTVAYGVVATAPVPGQPATSMFDPARHALYVLGETGGLTVVDSDTHAVVARPAVPYGANSLHLDPARHVVYAADPQLGSITAIDEDTFAVKQTIQLGGAEAFAFDPVRHVFFAVVDDEFSPSFHWLIEFDETTHSVLSRTRTFAFPSSLVLNPRTHALYSIDAYTYGLGANQGHRVTVMDELTHQTVSVIRTNQWPQSMAIDPSSQLGFIVDAGGDVLTVDLTTNAVVRDTAVGDGPMAAAADPTMHVLYVANYSDGTVSVIDEASGQVRATVATGLHPMGVTVAGDRAWVSNVDDHGLSVVAPLSAPTVPTVPRDLGSYATATSATLRWSTPAYDGGAPITSYTATVVDGHGNPVGSCTTAQLSCTVNWTNQSPLVEYVGSVTARNSVGAGPGAIRAMPPPGHGLNDFPAPVVTGIEPAFVDTPPTTNNSVTPVLVDWVPPDPSYESDGMQIEAVDPATGATLIEHQVDSSWALISGLEVGRPYEIRLAMLTGRAPGEWSDPVTVTIARTPTTAYMSAPVSYTYGVGSTEITGEILREQRGPGAGEPIANAAVTLESRPEGSAEPFRRVAVGSSSDDGIFRFDHLRPAFSTEYRVVSPDTDSLYGSTSLVEPIEVRPSISAQRSASVVRYGRPASVNGGVAPAQPGRAISLERRTSSGWHTISTGRTDSASHYAFTVTARVTAQYRVHLASGRGLEAGTSTALTIGVTPVVAVRTDRRTVLRGKRFHVYGWTTPTDRGEVSLQRRTRGVWRTIGTMRQRLRTLPSGRRRVGFSFSEHASSTGNFVYRVITRRDAAFVSTVSPALRIRVRGA